MNAGRILREAGLDSDELRVTLTPVDPDRINIWPASRLMRLLWRAGISGVTIRRWVLVTPDLLRGDPVRLGRLVIHELVHVRQVGDQGYLSFTLRYLVEYVRGILEGKGTRQAYMDISAEREARAITQRLAGGGTGGKETVSE